MGNLLRAKVRSNFWRNKYTEENWIAHVFVNSRERSPYHDTFLPPEIFSCCFFSDTVNRRSFRRISFTPIETTGKLSMSFSIYASR
jgi:hypothetical protein